MFINGSKKSLAIILREQGKSYNEISREISVPKSTLSYWFGKMETSCRVKQENINKTKLIWSKNISDFNKTRAKNYLKNREKSLSRFAKNIDKISDRELLFLGLGLYLGEGEKNSKHRIRFVNSDPAIIIIILVFFQKICKVPNNKFKARIQCYDNQSYDQILIFWSQLTKIKTENFWQPQIVKSKPIKASKKLENGTLHLTIMDSKLNLKIMGWMQGIKFQFLPM